jgi:hypothetical protein
MTSIDQQRLQYRVGEHSTATAGGTIRPLVCAAALLMAAAAGGRAACADMVIVQQDNTPIASAPGVGGTVLTHVDAGVALTVLSRNGEWLQVTGAQLPSSGTLWVPAGRVGDIIAAPADMATVATATASTEAPQFRMRTGSTDAAATTALGTKAATESRSSGGVAVSTARSTQTNAARVSATVGQSTGTATSPAGDPTPAVGNPVPAEGNGVTAVTGNPTAAISGNPTSAISGNPTPAVSGNPTPAVGGNPTPAVGNSTPAITGNPTPAMSNATPAMGNSVTGFGGTTVRTQ